MSAHILRSASSPTIPATLAISINHKEYASKGVAGTGLGLGIAGTALGLLALSGRGLFGLGNAGSVAAGALAAEAITGGPTAFQAWQHSCNAELADQKALYDFALLSANARFNDRQTINSEMFGLYKSQIDADFGLYKNQRDQFDVLVDRIGKLETAAAVQAAVEPWRSKVTNSSYSCTICFSTTSIICLILKLMKKSYTEFSIVIK